MPVTINFLGRILVYVKKLHALMFGLGLKWVKYASVTAFGVGGVALAAGWYSLCWWVVDDLLSAHVQLQSAFEEALSHAPSEFSVGDILAKANFYFPIDTVGALATLYTGIWFGLALFVAAKSWAKAIVGFKGMTK